MPEQVFVPLMYGRTESEARDPTARLQSLDELATQLLSGPVERHSSFAAAEEKSPTTPEVAVWRHLPRAGPGRVRQVTVCLASLHTLWYSLAPPPDGDDDDDDD
jgi:hypothetical protein